MCTPEPDSDRSTRLCSYLIQIDTLQAHCVIGGREWTTVVSSNARIERLSDQKKSNKLRVNLNTISLEADLAYFGARLELVGEPKTSYQVAQLKVYKAIESALGENLKCLRKKESKLLNKSKD